MDKNIQKKICKMYQEDKLSMMQISQSLKIPPTTICYWLKKQKIPRRSISEAIFDVYVSRFDKKPFLLKHNLSDKEKNLKISGTMLYWGEGAKTGGTVKFANSDPLMIKVFLEFLRIVCGVRAERLKAIVHMYPDQDQKEIEFFWVSLTGISRKNFYKTHIHKGRVGTYKTKSVYGTMSINYSDKKLLLTIMSWINQYKLDFAEVAQR